MVFRSILSQTPSTEDMKRKLETLLSIQTHGANTVVREGLNHFVMFQLEVLGLSIRCRSVWVVKRDQSPQRRAQSSALHQREGKIAHITQMIWWVPSLASVASLAMPYLSSVEIIKPHAPSSSLL